jgi:GNAT superfamily N-acetyltransferase
MAGSRELSLFFGYIFRMLMKRRKAYGIFFSRRIRKKHPMEEILQELTPESVGEAYDACNIAYREFFSFPETRIYVEPDMWWYETGIEFDLFNGVMRTRLQAEKADEEIERVLAHFRERRLPFLWYVGPRSTPADLGERLLAQGMLYEETEPMMGLELLKMNEELQVSSRLEIELVTNAELLREWVQVWLCGAPEGVAEAIYRQYARLKVDGLGKRRFYLGRVNGEAVATGALCFGGGAVEVGHIVTRHEMRRQGIGAEITLAVLREAREMGYRVAVLTASSMGIEIYRRIGFREFGEMSWYCWKPE